MENKRKNSKIGISVIMPALNEEKNIESAINDTLQAFEEYSIDGEIIVVNDGSSDMTEELTRNIMKNNNHIKILFHDSPKGMGASFWDGVDSADREFVVLLPGDGENDPKEIIRYYRLLEHTDIVVPFNFDKGVRTFFRNVVSAVYRFIINMTFLTNFNYTNGTIIYRKSILKELNYRCSGFFFQTDMLIRLVKKGYLFAQIPYRLNKRKEGVSKAISYRSLIGVIRGYLKLFNDCYLKRKIKNDGNFTPDSVTSKRRK